jgi:hypothetical protein
MTFSLQWPIFCMSAGSTPACSTKCAPVCRPIDMGGGFAFDACRFASRLDRWRVFDVRSDVLYPIRVLPVVHHKLRSCDVDGRQHLHPRLPYRLDGFGCRLPEDQIQYLGKTHKSDKRTSSTRFLAASATVAWYCERLMIVLVNSTCVEQAACRVARKAVEASCARYSWIVVSSECLVGLREDLPKELRRGVEEVAGDVILVPSGMRVVVGEKLSIDDIGRLTETCPSANARTTIRCTTLLPSTPTYHPSVRIGLAPPGPRCMCVVRRASSEHIP